MATQSYPIQAGKRARDDHDKIVLSGTLVRPDLRSETLVLFACGFSGRHVDYVPHFAALLGKEVNVYVSELRRRGVASASRCIDDFATVDKRMRDVVEAERVFYVGHSMGMNVAAGTRDRFGTVVKGYYGISAYPSFGDTRTTNADPSVRSLQQRLVDVTARSGFGPLGAPLREALLDAPARFAIAGNDEVVGTSDVAVRARFQALFSDFPAAQTVLYAGRNHCFNYKPGDFAPFNKDDPTVLVNDILDFVRSH